MFCFTISFVKLSFCSYDFNVKKQQDSTKYKVLSSYLRHPEKINDKIKLQNLFYVCKIFIELQKQNTHIILKAKLIQLESSPNNTNLSYLIVCMGDRSVKMIYSTRLIAALRASLFAKLRPKSPVRCRLIKKKLEILQPTITQYNKSVFI